MDRLLSLFTVKMNGGSKPAQKSNSPAFKKTDKREKLGGKTYVLYKLGKYYYVKSNKEFKSLSTMRRRNGVKAY